MQFFPQKLNKLRMFLQKQAFCFLCEGNSRPVMKIDEKIVLKWGEMNLNVSKPQQREIKLLQRQNIVFGMNRENKMQNPKIFQKCHENFLP